MSADDENKRPDDDRFGATAAVDFILSRYELIRSTDGRNLLAPLAGGPAVEISEVGRTLSGDIYRDTNIALGRTTVGTALQVQRILHGGHFYDKGRWIMENRGEVPKEIQELWEESKELGDES